MALTRRNAQARLVEPLYELQDVPNCKRDLAGSQVIKLESRELWMRTLPELLLLCNEATTRFEERCRRETEKIKAAAPDGEEPKIPLSLVPVHSGKALSLEYVCDRMDLDDPLHGYVVRTKQEGWIQGFITVTTFTSWQRWFRWDSLVDEAGVLSFDCEGTGMDALHSMGLHCDYTDESKSEARWWRERVVDADGSLAAALNAEIRDGDPDAEGIIWPHVAELSLLGGIGCGSVLVNLIIEELEGPDSPYHYIVLQATENSVPFYEKHGFVRVGAVARYFDKNRADAPASTPRAGAASVAPMAPEAAAAPPAEAIEEPAEPEPASKPRREIALAEGHQRHQRPRRGAAAKRSREPEPDAGDVPLNGRRQDRARGAATRGQSEASAKVRKVKTGVAKQADGKAVADATASASATSPSRRVALHSKSPALPQVQGASSKFSWYKVRAEETPTIVDVARKFDVLPSDVVFLNQRLYGEDLTETAELLDAVMLRIPQFPSFFDPIKHRPRKEGAPPKRAAETAPMVSSSGRPGQLTDNKLWYRAKDNETPRVIAGKIGVEPRDLIRCNAKMYPELSQGSPLMENTLLRVPGRYARPDDSPLAQDELLWHEQEQTRLSWGWGSNDEQQQGLSDVMTYRHWAFSDDAVEMAVSSYMMVRPLKKRERPPPPRKGRKRVDPMGDLKYTKLARKVMAPTDHSPPVFAYGADVAAMQAAQESELAEGASEEGGAGGASKALGSDFPKNINVLLRCSSACRSPASSPKAGKANGVEVGGAKFDPAHRMGPLFAALAPVGSEACSAVVAMPRPKRRRASAMGGRSASPAPKTLAAAPPPAVATVTAAKAAMLAASTVLPPLEVRESACVRVFLRNAPFVGPRLTARLSQPLDAKGVNLVKPVKPRKPRNPYMCFCKANRSLVRLECPDKEFLEVSSELGRRWREMDEASRAPYVAEAAEEKKKHVQATAVYLDQMRYYEDCMAGDDAPPLPPQLLSMVNQVVRLRPKPSLECRRKFMRDLAAPSKEAAADLGCSEAVVEYLGQRQERGEDDTYYFVLTYIPDLYWCRLCPLRRSGTFDKRAGRHAGRPKWTLVPMEEAIEVDVSAVRCDKVASVAVKRTADADHEEWDILESEMPPSAAAV